MLQKLINKFRKKSKPLFANTQFADVQGNSQIVSWNYSTSPNATAASTGGVISFDDVAAGVPVIDKPERIVKKPVEVYTEILIEEPVIDMSNIKTKITVVKKRLTMLKELGLNPGDEIKALKYLEARAKLLKEKKYTIPWKTTTRKLIDDLCNKYKLMACSFSGYYKNVPNEALEQLEAYQKMWKKYRGEDTPEVGLVCDEGGKEQKKDPILYASSPFGNWYYVLGAWDKEVEYVDEIIYGGK